MYITIFILILFWFPATPEGKMWLFSRVILELFQCKQLPAKRWKEVIRAVKLNELLDAQKLSLATIIA